MAEGLTLKVSKEKYTKAMESLQTKVTELEDCQSSLEQQKTKIEKAFTGAVGSTYVLTINQQVENIKTAIKKVNTQITQIENYVATMSTAGNTAMEMANQAGKAADSVFDEIVGGVSAATGSVSDDIEFFEEYYNQLPEWLRDKISDLMDDIAGQKISDVISGLRDLFTGDLSWDTLKDFVNAAVYDSEQSGLITNGTYVNAFIDLVKDYTDSDSNLNELLSGMDFYEQLAAQNLADGDYAEGTLNFLKSAGTGAFSIVYESTEVMTELIADAVDKVLKPIDFFGGMTATFYEGTNGWQSSTAEFVLSWKDDFVQTIRDWL